MAKTNKSQDILENIIMHLGRFAGKLKRMDRRFLVLSGIAIVLVIVMLSLIIHGIKINQTEEITTTTNNVSNITDATTTDVEEANTVVLNGAGMYKINTGKSPYLNMRLAADKESAVVTTIPNGTEIEVLFIDDRDVETDEDFGWGYVEYNGDRGWVFMQYLENK